ncbi:MAG: hypothetical protein ABIE55_01835 [Candidatus Aenigmatarchaeota archaeon]
MKKIISLMLLFLILANIALAQTPSLEIIEYEKEMLIEKGWIRYLNVKVKNSGDVELDNVEVFISDGNSNWFEVQTEKTNIAPNQTASFIVKLHVPVEEEKGKYAFSLNAKSNEVSVSEGFTIRVFTSRSEMVLYQIQGFRDSINNLKQDADRAEKMGKDIDSIKESLYEAESLLNAASNFVTNGLYEDATENIIDAENFIKRAEYDLSIPQAEVIETIETLSIEWILIIALLIIVLGMFLFFVLKGRKVGRRLPMMNFDKPPVRKVPGLKIKKLLERGGSMLDNRGPNKKTEEEIIRLEDAEGLLEEEYKEGLISSESYEELKSKYEEKILNMRTRKSKK